LRHPDKTSNRRAAGKNQKGAGNNKNKNI